MGGRRGRSRTVEDTADLDIHKLVRDRFPEGDPVTTRRIAGRLHLRWGAHLAWRMAIQPSGCGILHLKVNDEGWSQLALRRHIASERWLAECPHCSTGAYDLFFVPGWEGLAGCRECMGLRYKRDQLKTQGSYELTRDLRAGDRGAIADALQSPGPRALDALKAMEEEGLIPRQTTLTPRWGRRRRRRDQ